MKPFSTHRALILICCVVATLVVAVVVVVQSYGAASFFPALVAGFIGTLFAFLLALWSERRRDEYQWERTSAELQDRQATEIRRRFASVDKELEKDAESLNLLTKLIPAATGNPSALVHPQLLDGAWHANAPRLAELVAEYDLIGDLAITYGRIEELRWRLRHRVDLAHALVALDTMTLPLVRELIDEVTDLRAQVRKQIEEPHVQPLGLLHTASFRGAVTMTGSVVGKVVRANGSTESFEA